MPTDPTRTDTPQGDGAAPDASASTGPGRPDGVPVGDGGPAPPASVAPRSHRGRQAGRWALGLLALVALAVVGVLVFLQTAAGRNVVRGQVVAQLEKIFADDAEISAEAVAGNFLSGARLIGLEVRRDGEVVVAADTVLVDYNLTSLLRRTFSASQLVVSGPRVFVRQRADETFNVAGLLKPAEDDEQRAGITVVLDEVAVRDGLAEVRWYRADGRDSVHTVRDLAAVVQDFRQDGDSLSGDIRRIAFQAVAPYDRTALDVTGSGRFTNTDLRLRDLAVVSEAGTRVNGRATLDFSPDDDGRRTLPVFDAVIEGAPLALSDVRDMAGVQVFGDPRFRLRADSDGGVLSASLSGSLDDAALNLDGEFTRDADGPVRYRAEGSLRRFNPADLLDNPDLAAEVTGDLRLNLQGTTLETLSGPFRVALRESRVGGQRIDRLLVDGSFAAGRVTFDVDGAIPGASLDAEGSARPFEDVPTYQVAGTARDVQLGLLLPGSGRTDSFAGEFALIGRGATAETFSGTLALDLDRATVDLPNGPLRFADLQLDADISGGVAEFDADLTLADGQGRLVVPNGRLVLDPLSYDLRDARASGLNLAALTGNPSQDSDLTGTFSLSGEGTDLTAAPVDLTAQLGPSRYGTYQLASADLGVSLRRGVAQIDADLDLGPGGQLTAVGTARPFAQPLAFDLEGTMRNLDLASVQGEGATPTDLTGTYALSGAGVDPATMTLDGRVAVTEPSSFGDRFVDGADLAINLSGGALRVDGVLDTPEGSFDIALSGRPFDENPSFAFDGTCFSDLDLADFAESAPRTRLNGCFSGQVAGLGDVETLDADGRITLRPSRINEAEVEDGTVSFSLSNGALDADADLTLLTPVRDEGVPEGGRVAFELRARGLFDETPSYAVNGSTQALDVTSLLDLPPDQPLRLSVAFDLNGRGTDPATMTLDGSVRTTASQLGPVALDDLTAQFALANGVLAVDTLRVASDLVNARGAGTLALFNPDAASNFQIEGAVESLAPIASTFEPDSTGAVPPLGLQSGTFQLSVGAEPRQPLRVLGTVDVRQLVYGDYAVTGLNADIDGSWDRTSVDSLGLGALDGQVRASFAVLDGPTFRVEEGRATVEAGEDGTFTVESALTVDDRRRLELSARVDPERDGIGIERGRLELDGREWQLLQPAEVAIRDGLYDVRGFLLSGEDGTQIAIDGQVDLQGEQNLIVTAEGVPIGAFTDFVNLDALGGDLTASLVLSGPAEAPLIDGTVEIDDLTSRGRTVGALSTAVSYADGRMELDAVLTHIDGEELTIDGTVPLAFALADGPGNAVVPDDAQVALRARAGDFPIAWARPFLDDRTYTALGGTLRLDLTVAGTQGRPRLDGIATLSDGRLGVAATGRVYSPIQADLTFQNDRISLDDVRILDENGQTALDVTGQIRLRELSVGELDLTIRPRQFLAMNTPTFDGLVLDGGTQPLRLTGTLDRPVLRGAVALAQGDIYLTDELIPPDLAPVELTDAQIREVEARFGRVITARDTAVSRFVDALDYDLTVEIRRNVWLRSNSGLPFDIEFEGDLEASKTPFAEGSRLFGGIDVVRGNVETLNRQFEVERGTITFNGDPLAARIDLLAALDVKLSGSIAGQSSAQINLAVTGRFDQNPTIRLSSNPSMDDSDIVSLIATGRLADEFASTGAAAGLAGGFLGGAASGYVERLAAENLGLSTARFNYEGGDLVIEVGDYFSDRLFWTVGFILPVGESSRDGEGLPLRVTLDYELYRWLSAQTEISGQRGLGGGGNAEISW